jgi:hypothetical protein
MMADAIAKQTGRIRIETVRGEMQTSAKVAKLNGVRTVASVTSGQVISGPVGIGARVKREVMRPWIAAKVSVKSILGAGAEMWAVAPSAVGTAAVPDEMAIADR